MLNAFFNTVEQTSDSTGRALERLSRLVRDIPEVFLQILSIDADVGQVDLAHDGQEYKAGDIGGIADVLVGGVDIQGDIALGRLGAAEILDGDRADVDAWLASKKVQPNQERKNE